MFVVYNYEVGDTVYIFDDKTEARKCKRLLEKLNSYNSNARGYDVTHFEEFNSYEEIKNDQIETLEGCGEGEVILLYNGKRELVRV